MFDEDRREDHRPECPATSLTTRQQTIDQEGKGTFELRPRCRLWKLKRLPEELRRRPGSELPVTTRSEFMGEQSETTEPIRQSGGGNRRQFAQCPDAQPFERLRKVEQGSPGSQQRDWQRSEIAPCLRTGAIGIDPDGACASHHLRPAYPRSRSGGNR
jgi:hypothetical protein